MKAKAKSSAGSPSSRFEMSNSMSLEDGSHQGDVSLDSPPKEKKLTTEKWTRVIKLSQDTALNINLTNIQNDLDDFKEDRPEPALQGKKPWVLLFHPNQFKFNREDIACSSYALRPK